MFPLLSGQYRDELSRLRNTWVVLNEIADLSTTEEEDNSVSSRRAGRLGFIQMMILFDSHNELNP